MVNIKFLSPSPPEPPPKRQYVQFLLNPTFIGTCRNRFHGNLKVSIKEVSFTCAILIKDRT